MGQTRLGGKPDRQALYGTTDCAIVIINMLRNSMQLDRINALMTYINGHVDDRSDDIIPDRELFSLLCSVVYEADRMHSTDRQVIASIIESHLRAIEVRMNNRKRSSSAPCFVWFWAISRLK